MIYRRPNSESLQEVSERLGEREYEQQLSQLVEKDTSDVFSWTALREMSRDVLMKNYYLQQMMECIRRNGDVMSYLKGITYTHNIEEPDLNRELADEMIKRHPISGRFFKLMCQVPPTVFLFNPFD